MIQVRAAKTRGHADHGWLQTWHSFSFADYHNPQAMNWGPLRVINEDIIAPGQGFPMHSHHDMEILTLILSGTLEHRDNLGHSQIIHTGQIQRMSAGTGIRHSEFNPSNTTHTHLLQIWITPQQTALPPSYEQINPPPPINGWQTLASQDGRLGSAPICQDMQLHQVHLTANTHTQHTLDHNRLAYIHLISGQLTLQQHTLTPGDAAQIAQETQLEFTTQHPCRFLLFDLPPSPSLQT